MKSTKPRVILNGRLAAQIYAEKLALIAPTTFESCLKDLRVKIKGKSAKVATKYGVSAKTIRDIWNRRTWTTATSVLWGCRRMLQYEVLHITACESLEFNFHGVFRFALFKEG
jgi:hypothetical protein